MTPIQELETLRKKAKMTVTALAEYLGVNRAQYNNWKAGRKVPCSKSVLLHTRLMLQQKKTGKTVEDLLTT